MPSLASVFDQALQHLPAAGSGAPGSPSSEFPNPARPKSPAADAFLYSGNRHETVPRRLFLDRRLTPLERNAWQVFRLQLNDDGVTAFPTYDELRPYLASVPCGAQASHETVARALTLLRLTRWLSLVRRRRDPKTGRLLGNLYVLHDEPLTPFEAMQLDPEYLGLVSQALTHSAKAIQLVGLHTLQEIADDPMLAGRSLPTRLQLLAERMSSGPIQAKSYPQKQSIHDSEEGPTALLRNRDAHSSDSEPGRKPAPAGALRNPKQDRTVRTVFNKEVRTVPRDAGATAPGDLVLPDEFSNLKAEEQAGAMVALQQVEAGLRQAVLDEWSARCRSMSVRNQSAYLFGIIQRALRGEFKAWAGSRRGIAPPGQTPPPRPIAVAPAPIHRPADPAVARAYLARMRESLRRS